MLPSGCIYSMKEPFFPLSFRILYKNPPNSPTITLCQALITSSTSTSTPAPSTRVFSCTAPPPRSMTFCTHSLVSSSSFAFSSATRRRLFAFTLRRVKRAKRRDSRRDGSAMARGRRERRRAQKSAVRAGRGRVEGPAAWRRRERVRRRRGRRGAEVSGVVVPLFGGRGKGC